MKTANNEKYLRLWFEIQFDDFNANAENSNDAVESAKRWFPYNKGGEYRRWYGNREYSVNWENDGMAIKSFPNAVIRNESYYFREGLTWSLISSSNFGIRYSPVGAIFDGNGSSMFAKRTDMYELLGFMSSCVTVELLAVLSPTLTFEIGQLSKLPYLPANSTLVRNTVKENIIIAREDWDSFETSWDFTRHPLVMRDINDSIQFEPEKAKLSYCYEWWDSNCNKRFMKMKENEEELNRYFISIYGLNSELHPDVQDKEITIHRANLQRDIKSFLSYAIGCMFGRYSLDVEGLAYAGGDWDSRKYTSFIPDTDNVIPITDEEYLEDDIVSRLCEWLKVVYGKETLEENLDFIAKALGNKGSSSREIIRNYFLTDFFKDHCQTYSVTGSGKRPIYWLFDSGKQNGFKALIYLHRYNADTIGNLRIDYLHRMQRIYESEIARMQDMIDNSTNNREVAQATKRREKLTKQLKECREYDEKLAHLALSRIELDLDDGVKVNYRKLQTANDGKFYEVLADSKNIMAKK